MKKLSESKTLKFNVIMGGIQALNGSISLLAPLMPVETFAVVTVLIGVIHAMGGAYLRTITSEPISK